MTLFLLTQEGNNSGSACQSGAAPRATRPADRPRPTAAVVARRAIKKRWMRGKALSVESAACDIRRQEKAGKRDGDASNEQSFSATCVCSPYLPGGRRVRQVSCGKRYVRTAHKLPIIVLSWLRFCRDTVPHPADSQPVILPAPNCRLSCTIPAICSSVPSTFTYDQCSTCVLTKEKWGSSQYRPLPCQDSLPLVFECSYQVRRKSFSAIFNSPAAHSQYPR